MGTVNLVRATPDTPTLVGYRNRTCNIVGGGAAKFLSILIGKRIHSTIESSKAIQREAQVILVTFYPFGSPLKGGLPEQMPDGIDKIEGVFRRVRNKPRVKDSKNRLVIASNMDRSGGDLVEGTDDASQKNDAIHAGEFTAVGVAITNRAGDRVDSADGVGIRRTHKGEGSSTTLGGVKRSITNSKAVVRGDGCGDVGSAGGSIYVFKGPSFFV
jgi:hypothetical protein